jgi:hypothetical protein
MNIRIIAPHSGSTTSTSSWSRPLTLLLRLLLVMMLWFLTPIGLSCVDTSILGLSLLLLLLKFRVFGFSSTQEAIECSSST